MHRSLDWASNERDDVSDVFSSLEHVSSVDVRLDGLDVSEDVSEVGEGVVEDGHWSQSLSPCLNGGDVVLDVLAVLDVPWDGLKHESDLLNGLDVVGKSASFEVSNSDLDHGLELFGISDAAVDVLEVLVLDQSVEKSLNKLEVFGSSLEWSYFDLGWFSESENNDFSNIVSDLLELSSSLRSLDVSDISVNLWVVLEDSLGGSSGNNLWVLEEISPLLENWESLLDLLAVSNVLWELRGHLSDNGEGVQDAGDVVCLEVSKDNFHVGLKDLLVLDAGLEVSEVFHMDKSSNESFEEKNYVSDLFWYSLKAGFGDKQVSEDNSNIVSSVVVVSSLDFLVEISTLSHNFLVVLDSIADNDLSISFGISELGGPLLDASNILRDLLAVRESNWNLFGES